MGPFGRHHIFEIVPFPDGASNATLSRPYHATRIQASAEERGALIHIFSSKSQQPRLCLIIDSRIVVFTECLPEGGWGDEEHHNSESVVFTECLPEGGWGDEEHHNSESVVFLGFEVCRHHNFKRTRPLC